MKLEGSRFCLCVEELVVLSPFGIYLETWCVGMQVFIWKVLRISVGQFGASVMQVFMVNLQSLMSFCVIVLANLHLDYIEASGLVQFAFPSRMIVRWTLPLVGCYKVNIDGAVESVSGNIGVGELIGDRETNLKAAMAKHLPAVMYSPQATEMIAILEALLCG